jgi:hypothetical protein
VRSFTGLLGSALSGPGNVVPGLVPSAAIRAKQCYFPRSSWIYAFILTCDDKLAVWFKRRARGARAGGVPGVCCLYPQSNRRLYNLAVTSPSAGRFVHRFLYRILAYALVAPPKSPCGSDCSAGVSVGCCADPLPTDLTATFTGAISGSVALGYSGLSGVWEGTATLCGGAPSTIGFNCDFLIGTGYVFNLGLTGSGGGCNAATTVAASASCSPLSVTFHMTGNGGCCNGQSFTVTVTP